MDWCNTPDPTKANHNPIAVLDGDTGRRIVRRKGRPGETITLSASGSRDPDGDSIEMSWFIYREAGSFVGEVSLSSGAGETTRLVIPEEESKSQEPSTIHVILQVKDGGQPPLHAYRRTIVTCER
jgi:hypothetical protein